MPEKLKSLARRIYRAWWMARIHWAMDRWYRSKKRACRKINKLDRMLWRYDVLFGEEKP